MKSDWKEGDRAIFTTPSGRKIRVVILNIYEDSQAEVIWILERGTGLVRLCELKHETN